MYPDPSSGTDLLPPISHFFSGLSYTEMTNTTTEQLLEPIPDNGSHFFVIGVLTIPTSIIGTVGSVATVYLIAQQKKQTSSTNALIVNLCVATFLLCGTSSFFDAFTMITGSPGPTGDNGSLCIMFAFLHFLWLSVSAHSHAAIAIHRLVAVVLTERAKFMTSKVIAVSLVTYTWLVPLLVLVFPLVNVGGRYGFSNVASRCSVVEVFAYSYEIVLKLMNSFVPLAVMVICYAVIFIKVIRSRMRFNFDESAIRGQGARGAPLLRLKAEIRVTRIAFLTCACFIICYIPSSVHGLIATKVSEMVSPLAQIFVLMTWIGCAVTPILYTILSTEMRSTATKECRRLIRRYSNIVDVQQPISRLYVVDVGLKDAAPSQATNRHRMSDLLAPSPTPTL